MLNDNLKQNKMNIDEILNSDFFKENILDIEKENKEIEESGWTREEINEMANFIIKKKINNNGV